MSKWFVMAIALLASLPVLAQKASCWPKDMPGGTGSTAIVVQAPLGSGPVRETEGASCAVGWACITTYGRELPVAVFDRCTAPPEQLRQAALAALADARATPAWAELVTSKCDDDATDQALALCKQARDAVLADKATPAPPAFAASAPTLFDSAGAAAKELQAVPGTPCTCDPSTRRLSVRGELRCTLSSGRAPQTLFAACDRR